MNYVRRGKRLADLIREEATYLVVELKDQRRVRWPKDKRNTLLAFGSLNPKSANYEPGGKIVGTR